MSTNSPRPKTSQEAEEMMQEAINNNDFALAKHLASEIESLIIFEEEVALAKDVHQYYQQKQNIVDTLEQDTLAYIEEVEKAEDEINTYYQTEFYKLKDRQISELEDVLDKWEAERSLTGDNPQIEFEHSMETARILARQQKFEEAIKIKEEAQRKLEENTKKTSKKLDQMYRRKCDTMITRQENEMQLLIEKREVDMQLLDSLKIAAQDQALDSFWSENSSSLLSIINRIPTNIRVPKSLQMQAVNARQATPKEALPGKTASPRFKSQMEATRKTLGISVGPKRKHRF